MRRGQQQRIEHLVIEKLKEVQGQENYEAITESRYNGKYERIQRIPCLPHFLRER